MRQTGGRPGPSLDRLVRHPLTLVVLIGWLGWAAWRLVGAL